MDKTHFALSLGFAGLILATQVGWGGSPVAAPVSGWTVVALLQAGQP